ncbi:nuclear transport factor 2 family protein [Sinomonas humi]|uniref:nuclear transport factor 2 family protein n=1 Tax=Sinomonas humi TaxID=1338436 RepID=UPI00068E76A8|nr:nuclear transport factor 2 family protein [Sinomonas humi]
MSTQDVLDIQDVLFAYATHLDKRTPEAMADEVFTTDVVIDLGYGAWEGIGKATAEYRREVDLFHGTAHVLTNPRISVDGDTAKSSVYVTAWHWTRGVAEGKEPNSDFVTVGVYLDRLVRTDGGWRISHRRFRRLGPSAIGIGTLPSFIQPEA